MKTQVSTEKTYTLTYYTPATKTKFGVSVSVTGDSKTKVRRESKELLEQAMSDTKEIEQKYSIQE